MTLNYIRRDRSQFMRHFGKEPKTISMHPQDFHELVNDTMGMEVSVRSDSVHYVMGMELIADPKMPIGEIVLQ